MPPEIPSPVVHITATQEFYSDISSSFVDHIRRLQFRLIITANTQIRTIAPSNLRKRYRRLLDTPALVASEFFNPTQLSLTEGRRKG